MLPLMYAYILRRLEKRITFDSKMPVNKLALIRYKTIDQCLQNYYRKWTLEDLIDACSDAIYEYEGIKTGVSKRSVQADIQMMRSSKLGYNAPIIVVDKKYYTYASKTYSITQMPITGQDLNTLNEVVQLLGQFNDFDYFEELSTMVTKLEDKLLQQKKKGPSYIQFEKNDLVKGLNWVNQLHKMIITKKPLEIGYRSFKAREKQEILFSPYLLKEYRNRWFLFGAKGVQKQILILALDRIETVQETNRMRYQKPHFDVFTYFNDAIGVSKMPNQEAQLIVFKVDHSNAPYVITKPLHSSQQILKEESDGVIFSIFVVWNFELEREMLGFGEQLKILSPRRVRSSILARLRKAMELYTVKK